MNDLETMIDVLQRLLPDVRVELDAPESGAPGFWYAFFQHSGHDVAVEWRPGQGFGVTSSRGQGYGERPDETYEDQTHATARVINLLVFRRRTVPRRQVLSRIRESLGVSQADLARRLGVQQAAVSKIESRIDPSLSSLWKYVQALGGEPEGLFARFGEEEYIVVPFLLAHELQEKIKVATRASANREARRRAADFLRKAMDCIREIGQALKMPDLEEKAAAAIKKAEAA